MRIVGRNNVTYYSAVLGDTLTIESSDGSFFGSSGDDSFYSTFSQVAFYGGLGNDSLSVENGQCYIDGGAGNDLIYIGYGQGSAYGGEGDDQITLVTGNGDLHGGAGSDILRAYGGDAVLDGGDGNDALLLLGGHGQLLGGAGHDMLDTGYEAGLMVGGTGNDTYVVRHVDQVCAEATAEGFDTIRTDLEVYWVNFANIECLVGTRETGQALGGYANAIALFGAGGADTLYSGGFDDWLDGGAGVDLMVGGDGNDIYVVDTAADICAETATGGSDEIRTGLSTYGIIVANIERLVGIATSGQSLATDLGDQTIIGNVGQDTLNAGRGNDTLDGGAGIDLLIGGEGNDVYLVDHANDICAETLGGGVDEIRTGLASFGVVVANIERLVGTSASGQSLATDLGSQTIVGNSGADVLNAGRGDDTLIGGAGADTLFGGEGADLHLFDILDGNGDRIYGFVSGIDSIGLAASTFGLSAGALDANRFVSTTANPATAATQAFGQIIYAAPIGDIYWDANGTAAGGLSWLGRTELVNALTAQDFRVI